MKKKLQYVLWILIVVSLVLSPVVVSAEDVFLPLVSRAAKIFQINCGSEMPLGWTVAFNEGSACALRLEIGFTYKVKAVAGWQADGDPDDISAPFDQVFNGPVTFWRLDANATPLEVSEVATPTPTVTEIPTNTPTATMTNTVTATPTPTIIVPQCVVPLFEGWTVAFNEGSACALRLEIGFTYKVKAVAGWQADGDPDDISAPFDQVFNGPVTFWRLDANATPLEVSEVATPTPTVTEIPTNTPTATMTNTVTATPTPTIIVPCTNPNYPSSSRWYRIIDASGTPIGCGWQLVPGPEFTLYIPYNWKVVDQAGEHPGPGDHVFPENAPASLWRLYP